VTAFTATVKTAPVDQAVIVAAAGCSENGTLHLESQALSHARNHHPAGLDLKRQKTGANCELESF
jgi:hypothetical protein